MKAEKKKDVDLTEEEKNQIAYKFLTYVMSRDVPPAQAMTNIQKTANSINIDHDKCSQFANSLFKDILDKKTEQKGPKVIIGLVGDRTSLEGE